MLRECSLLSLWLFGFVAGCETAPSGAALLTCAPYPETPGVARGVAVPDLHLEGIDEHGDPGTIQLSDYYEPCATASRLLVMRIQGGSWCGTCRWHAAHTNELLSGPAGARLRVLDLVLGDRDNAPAHLADLTAWRALLDSPRVATAVDPAFSLRELVTNAGTILPLFVFVDTRSMKVLGTAANPNPIALATEVDRWLAQLDSVAPAPAEPEPLIDGIFRRNEWDLLRDVVTPAAPPPDLTNEVGDSPAAAALGKALFFDAGLSPSNQVSCATCHDPQLRFSDGRPQARGVGHGNRRTPRIALAAFSRWQFWDGRADSLWAQALAPLENDDELGSSRLFVARRIAATYAGSYAAAFPNYPLPALDGLPKTGKPGDPSYDRLTVAAKHAVTRVFVDAGKAIAAFERTLRVRPNRLDAYVAGDFNALMRTEKQGLSVFLSSGCMQCHYGPRLTDDAFHVTRTPSGRHDGAPDEGRAGGLIALDASEFRSSSEWSDAPTPLDARSTDQRLVGQFKTPSLRGVAGVAPYGHGGTRATLVEVMADYGQGGLAVDDARAVGAREQWLPRFDTTVQWSIAALLTELTADPVW